MDPTKITPEQQNAQQGNQQNQTNQQTEQQQQTQPQSAPPAQDDSGRTAQEFEKLKQSNKQLYEANQLLQQELQKKSRSEGVFTPFNSPQQTPPPSQEPSQNAGQTNGVNVSDFIETDPNTGEQYVNQDKLQVAIKATQERAMKAERAVQDYITQQREAENRRQTVEAFGAYPDLDPNNTKHNPDFLRHTRSLVFDSIMNKQEYGGVELTFKQAADLAHKYITQGQAAGDAAKKEIEEQQQQQKVENETKKEQASLAPQGSGQSAQQAAGQEDWQAEKTRLVAQTRAGDMWALARRLTRAPHTGTPTSSQEE